jgi:hypothetical protein
MMRSSKAEDPEIGKKALQLIENMEMPVSIEYVSIGLGVAWATARMILFGLALKEKVVARRTTSGWIFSAKK